MKQFILIISIFFSISVFGQDGPMDTYEKRMFKEYNYHNIKELFTYVNENDIADKERFNIGDRKYKARVKRFSKRAEYDESVFMKIKSGRYVYYISKRRKTVDIHSDQLTFNLHYNKIKKEYTFVSNRSQGFSHEFKVYGYVFAYENGEMVKLEDWVIRDAYGRANSINKPRK